MDARGNAALGDARTALSAAAARIKELEARFGAAVRRAPAMRKLGAKTRGEAVARFRASLRRG